MNCNGTKYFKNVLSRNSTPFQVSLWTNYRVDLAGRSSTPITCICCVPYDYTFQSFNTVDSQSQSRELWLMSLNTANLFHSKWILWEKLSFMQLKALTSFHGMLVESYNSQEILNKRFSTTSFSIILQSIWPSLHLTLSILFQLFKFSIGKFSIFLSFFQFLINFFFQFHILRLTKKNDLNFVMEN